MDRMRYLSAPCADERRKYHYLRLVLDAIFPMVEPFFDPDGAWPARLVFHLIFRMLSERFQGVRRAGLHSLVVSLHRACIDRHPLRSDHLFRQPPVGRSAA